MSHLKLFPAIIIAGTLFVWGPAGTWAQENSSASPTSTEKEQLTALLASDGSYAEKLSACKRLALIGDKSSVAALAALLADEKLSLAARIALEAIPDPEAGDALRHALTEVKGELLVGVINSIGARGDRKAVPGLRQLLGDSDPQVASAAAAALGKIATPEAVQLLEKTLPTATPAARPAIGHATLACAEAFFRQGNRDLAVTVYDHLLKATLPKQILIAATRGAILARGSEGVALLVGELAPDDDARFAMAIGVSREFCDATATKALLGCLPRLSPDRQALLITVLGDRGDVEARPAVVEAARKSARQVRLAAIRALATLGDASVTAVLLGAANQSDPEIAAAAVDTLAALADPEVDLVVAKMIETTDGKTRRIVVELAGRRQMSSAVPALLKAADSPDEETRLAAIAALGKTIAPEQLPVLTERLVASTSAKELAVVEMALKVACRRSVDKEACAGSLVKCLPQASQQVRCFVLELLGSVGGSTALTAVSAAALDPNEETQDVATRVLGQWLSPDAAPALLELTRELPQGKYQIRALRGCIRILRQMDVPCEQRLVMCREAMQLARRDQERALVLEALGRIPSREALALVVPYLQSPTLKKMANVATVSIAEKIVSAEPLAVSEAMKKVLQATTDNDLHRRAKELMVQAEMDPAIGLQD